MPGLLIIYSAILYAAIILLHYVMGRVMVSGILFLSKQMESWNVLRGRALYWMKQIVFAVFGVVFWLVSFATMFVLIAFYFSTWFHDQYGAVGEYTVLAFWITNYILGFGYPIYVHRQKLRAAGFLHI
ncbi:MAG: hypothetical protein GKS03_00160 [Alphaproteobacteria bacterium]|nr:hypothetical protein [Alphaproteobacteria bacterium]